VINRKISKILVPLDGSKNSLRGLEYAISLARHTEGIITGVYSLSTGSHSEFKGVGTVEPAHNKEIKKIMADAKTTCAKNGIVFKERLMKGDTGYNIVKLAHGKDKFDVIVIGSRGRSSAKEMFFGSVSNYVVHASKIPVLIVK